MTGGDGEKKQEQERDMRSRYKRGQRRYTPAAGTKFLALSGNLRRDKASGPILGSCIYLPVLTYMPVVLTGDTSLLARSVHHWNNRMMILFIATLGVIWGLD